MDSARKALRGRRGLKFKGPQSSRVKNVEEPLRYWKLLS